MAKDDDDESELNELSDVYSVLKQDAKSIIADLRGGVIMWREAAGANVAVAGFVIVLALTSLHYGPEGIEGFLIRLGYLFIAAVSIYYATIGFRKYFRLLRKYQGLFERVRKLE